MQNSIKKFSFRVDKGNYLLELGHHSLNNQFLNVASLFQQFEKGFLVKPCHKFIQTQYFLNEVKGCYILSFDENKTLVSLKKFVNENALPNTYLISDEYVLFLPLETYLPVSKVSEFKFMETPSLPKNEPSVAVLLLDEDQTSFSTEPKFPYIILRIMPALYHKYAIRFDFDIKASNGEDTIYFNPNFLPNDMPLHDLLANGSLDEILKKKTIELAKDENIEKACIVLQKDRCFYYQNEEFTESNTPPVGGTLILGNKIKEIPDMGNHF